MDLDTFIENVTVTLDWITAAEQTLITRKGRWDSGGNYSRLECRWREKEGMIKRTGNDGGRATNGGADMARAYTAFRGLGGHAPFIRRGSSFPLNFVLLSLSSPCHYVVGMRFPPQSCVSQIARRKPRILRLSREEVEDQLGCPPQTKLFGGGEEAEPGEKRRCRDARMEKGGRGDRTSNSKQRSRFPRGDWDPPK